MNILIVYPHGNALNPHSGAETRIWNLVKILVKNNFNVSVLHSKNSKGFEDIKLKRECTVYYYKDLSFGGVPDWYLSDFNPFYILKLYQITRKQKFDIIQIEFPWGFYALKLISKKNTYLIYDSIGVESEFIKVSMKNPKFPRFLKPIAKILAYIYERFVCKLANVIINVSDVDRSYYLKNYKIKRSKTFLIQIPSGINPPSEFNNKINKDEARKRLDLPDNKVIAIFHGGFPHPPNKEAFDIILKEIAPKINLPEILFVLAGYKLKKFSRDNVVSLGFVENLSDLLTAADFAIIPLISGSGMRVKCADYITAALPFVTTSKAIEGIEFLENNKDCIIFEEFNEGFLDGIRKLYNDIDLRDRMHKNLQQKSNYLNQSNIEKRFKKLYLKLIES